MSTAEIERKALELLCKFNAGSRPVDVLQIANALGISVFEASFENDSISGLIRKEADGVKIYYNRAHNFRRIRFTIAHEIGHSVLGHLDKVRNQQIDDFALNMFRRADGVGGKDYQMEVDANKFAAALFYKHQPVPFKSPLFAHNLAVRLQYKTAHVQSSVIFFSCEFTNIKIFHKFISKAYLTTLLSIFYILNIINNTTE